MEQLAANEETWENWLEEQLYFFLLVDSFRPTNETLRSLVDGLASTKTGVVDTLHQVCLTASFDRRNPGADTFVTVVMEQILGLQVQRSLRELEAGKRIYDGARGTFLGKTGNSQSDILDIAFADRRAIRYYLSREHERIVGTLPEESALGELSRLFGSDPCVYADVLGEWALSVVSNFTCADRPLTNRMFVRALYVDLLDRIPSVGELLQTRTALDSLSDPRPLRALFSRLMLDSGEARLPKRDEIVDASAWINEMFCQLLGRSPTDSEEASFKQALSDSHCLPSTVAYAIVTHPEYQKW